MDPFIGEIRMFGGNFAPRGWAFCNGQLLSIAQNTALFSLLGTTYGGDGVTTFALPDLRGRTPIHFGQGPGLTPRTLGERSGSETVTLTANEMPAHNHAMVASTGIINTPSPENAFLGQIGEGRDAPPAFVGATSALTTMNPQSINPSGGSQPHNNMQPYLAVNYIISLEGIYPSRN